MNQDKVDALKTDIISRVQPSDQEDVRELLEDLQEEIKATCEVRLLRNNFNKRRMDYAEGEEEE